MQAHKRKRKPQEINSKMTFYKRNNKQHAKCTYSYIMSVTEFTITTSVHKNKYSTQNVIDKTNIKNNTILFQTVVYSLRCLTIRTLNLKKKT